MYLGLCAKTKYLQLFACALAMAGCGGNGNSAGPSTPQNPSVSGACGSADGVPVSAVSNANLCSGGAASDVVTSVASFVWNCHGGGATAQCSAPLIPAGKAMISWSVPSQNIDGTMLTDITGYRILYGSDPAALTNILDVPSTSTSYTFSGLPSGTYYFAVTTLNSVGEMSNRSALASGIVY